MRAVLWSYLLKSYDGRQLPTATTTHDAAGGRRRGGGKLRAKWEERIRSESGWKALLKAQHMITKVLSLIFFFFLLRHLLLMRTRRRRNSPMHV